MGKKSTRGREGARPHWETLEDWVRGNVQQYIQRLLEDGIAECLGRQKSERRDKVGAPHGYRNGYERSLRRRSVRRWVTGTNEGCRLTHLHTS